MKRQTLRTIRGYMRAIQTVEPGKFPGESFSLALDNGDELTWPVEGRETMDEYGVLALEIIAEAAQISTPGRPGVEAAKVLLRVAGRECEARLAAEDILKMLVEANKNIESTSAFGYAAGDIAVLAADFLARKS